MRYFLTAILAACLGVGAIATVTAPALAAVQHIAISHSPAPVPVFEYGSGAPLESPTMAPDAAKNHACDNYVVQMQKNDYLTHCSQPGIMQVPLVHVPM
jgi:hypothetical protein